tara:strand:+ start:500 stop:949 length:450 start_codon:yes stop_codon:yes gene_type:complete
MQQQDIFDLLTGVNIDGLTVANLDQATGRTYIDRDSVDFWQPIILLSTVMDKARTYSHGLPIPESGAVETQNVGDGADFTVQPLGTEVWLVQALNLDSCTCTLRTASGGISITAIPPGGLYLTNTLFLTFTNGTGSAKDPAIAYSKVSL